MPTYDVILVPGGGVRSHGQLPLWSQRRLERAIEIQTSEYVVCLSAGTTHKPPPLDEKGYPIFESVAAADYLVKQGIEPRKILVETSSYDTIGNAFFSKMIHVDPRGLRNLVIITSEFHRPRTEAIFRWIYALEPASDGYKLTFESVSDEGIDDSILDARKAKEENSLVNLLPVTQRIKTLGQFHDWLFTEHEAYSVATTSDLMVSDQVLDSY